MPRTLLLIFMSLVAFTAPAQDEVSGDRALLMECQYSDYGNLQITSVHIERLLEDKSRDTIATGIRHLTKEDNNKSVMFVVNAGDMAECVFPAGESIRVKAGEGIGRAYGACGADPEVFLSLWVNQRKVESKQIFAGHCTDRSQIKYTVFNNQIMKCAGAEPDADDSGKTPLQVCVHFPSVDRYPIDPLEYPPVGRSAPAVGSIEIENGSEAVCSAVQKELVNDWSSQQPDLESSLAIDGWTAYSDSLPPEISGASINEFDFDNDGKVDRVLRKEFESNYIDATVLLVQAPNTPTALGEETWVLPCQLNSTSLPAKDCSPFSQSHDETSLSFQHSDLNRSEAGNSVDFRVRYTHLKPIHFEGTTYLVATSQSEDSMNYVGVIKPKAGKAFEKTCLLRKVLENF